MSSGVWAARLIWVKLPERMTSPDLNRMPLPSWRLLRAKLDFDGGVANEKGESPQLAGADLSR